MWVDPGSDNASLPCSRCSVFVMSRIRSVWGGIAGRNGIGWPSVAGVTSITNGYLNPLYVIWGWTINILSTLVWPGIWSSVGNYGRLICWTAMQNMCRMLHWNPQKYNGRITKSRGVIGSQFVNRELGSVVIGASQCVVKNPSAEKVPNTCIPIITHRQTVVFLID